MVSSQLESALINFRMDEISTVRSGMASEEAMFARNPEVVAAGIGEEIVLLDSRNWNYVNFDEIGSRIWVHLEKPRTLSWLVEELVEEYATDHTVCRRDTEFFLRTLLKNGLVVSRESAHAARPGV
jgi:Coenzyme PQQ synthesis protein D (PqqD)